MIIINNIYIGLFHPTTFLTIGDNKKKTFNLNFEFNFEKLNCISTT